MVRQIKIGKYKFRNTNVIKYKTFKQWKMENVCNKMGKNVQELLKIASRYKK